jgi:hypothetical protein
MCIRSLRAGKMLPIWMTLVCAFPPPAYPWGGEHNRISAVAMEALPPAEQEYLRPERASIEGQYCEFPDLNWACYGQWGGGTGDPQAARMPDTRRLWGVSFYCQWDPVLHKGHAFPHAPPRSWEATDFYFRSAAAALAKGRLEDGCRVLGVMLHYIQDSGSFPHVQPIHRDFHVKAMENIVLKGYTPRLLGEKPETAAQALSGDVEKMTTWTEQCLAPLLASAGMPLEDAKRQAAQQLMAPAVVKAVAKLRAEKPAEFEAAATACANECARLCADAIHSALAFAQKPYVEPAPNALNVNLVCNSSFEDGDTDGAPTGWCVGWLDRRDRMGRAEWYRAGTHWEKHVRTGRHSALVLWPPKPGLEWQQTWPKAVRVRPGERYRSSVWGKAAATTGGSFLAVEFSNNDYHPILVAKSAELVSGAGWQRLSVDATIPPCARWLRIILHSAGSKGAAWFDDAEVVRILP